MKRKGFTLFELVIVIVIIGILATFGVSQYNPMRESALNKEAIANLKLIQAAQKVYNMENGHYANCLTMGWAGNAEACINDNLKLSLPANSNPNASWDYETYGTISAPGCVHCRRRASNTREFHIGIHEDEVDTTTGSCHP